MQNDKDMKDHTPGKEIGMETFHYSFLGGEATKIISKYFFRKE